ncbi:MAG: chromate transporter [Spirochaetaceae bacterium]|jgi:chromate transporter|nr:chromate transporter [Spirochaetaceae bacterium]
MKELLDLFFTFFKIGCITFGGGYAILPILERELIKKRAWTTTEELTECYAIAQITPGVIALNASTFIGTKRKGCVGGIVATLGFVIPGTLLIIIISLFLQHFKDMEIVQHAFSGIRLTVGALILGTVIKLVGACIKKENMLFRNVLSLFICVSCFTLSFVFKTNPVFLICASGIVGFLFFNQKRNA